MITVRGAAHRVARGSAGHHDTSRVNNRPRGTGGGNGTHRAAGRAGVVDVGRAADFDPGKCLDG